MAHPEVEIQSCTKVFINFLMGWSCRKYHNLVGFLTSKDHQSGGLFGSQAPTGWEAAKQVTQHQWPVCHRKFMMVKAGYYWWFITYMTAAIFIWDIFATFRRHLDTAPLQRVMAVTALPSL